MVGLGEHCKRIISRWRVIVVTASLLILLFLGANQLPSPPAPPRHLVLITVDALRADHLGAYGYSQASTPNFDALAADSIRFENTFSHASMTVPSVATLFTGRLPAAHTLVTNSGQLPEEMPTLATRLHGTDFISAGFIGNYELRPPRGFQRGFDLFTDEYQTTETVRPYPENRAGPLTDEAIEWISNQNPDRRLFLWVHYQEPHGAYTPPSFTQPETGGGEIVLPKNSTNSGINGIPKYQWLGHGRLEEYLARYDGEITEFDRHLGRLLEVLEASGILQQSLLVLTSDHGEAFGEDGLYCAHGEGLGEALLRVPLLLKIPGHKPGIRRDTVRLIDVARTALEVLAVDAQGFRGTNLLVDTGHRPIAAQVVNLERSWRSYRLGGSEIHQDLGNPPVVTLDQGLSQNEQESIARRLEEELLEAAPWPRPQQLESKPLSTEEREILRTLGYAE